MAREIPVGQNILTPNILAVILTEGSPLGDKINRAPLSERVQRE